MSATVPSSVCGGSILTGRFQDLIGELQPGSVDLIFTDPPYNEKFLPQITDLSAFASVVLRPGGLCMVVYGKLFLPQAMTRLASQLKYVWQAAILHTGGNTPIRKVKLSCAWKPVLLYAKPPYKPWWESLPEDCVSLPAGVEDMVSGGKEKDDHKWQQAVAEAEHYIKTFCPKGGLVVDPMIGSGTTLVAAKKLGFRWWGCDCDPAAAEKARKKLAGVTTVTGLTVPCESPTTAAQEQTDAPVTAGLRNGRLYLTNDEGSAARLRGLGLSVLYVNGEQTDWGMILGFSEVAVVHEQDLGGMQFSCMAARAIRKARFTGTAIPITSPGDPGPENPLARLFDGPPYEVLARLDWLFETGLDVRNGPRCDNTPIFDSPGRGFVTSQAWEGFPTQALPEPIRSFITTAAEAIGCDESYIAIPLLVGLASAIGNSRRIQLKRGWSEPAIIWAAIVGESGSLKSPALEVALRPIHHRQTETLKEYEAAIAEYQTDVAVYEREFADWKRQKGAPTGPPTPPTPPEAVRYWTADATVEAVGTLLVHNWRGLIIIRDELSAWFSSFDRYSQARGGDAPSWIEMHGGRQLIIDRKTGKKTLFIPRAAVGVVGGIQPAILTNAFTLENRANGLAPRLLLAYPPIKLKRWTEVEILQSIEDQLTLIFDRLYGLRPNETNDGDPMPVLVPMTPEGKAAWVRFYNAHAREQSELTGDLAAAWSKLEGYAARLALVVHFVRWAADDPTLRNPDAIDKQSITTGVTLSAWFGNEARRVHAALAEAPKDRDRRETVELIQRAGGGVSIRDWQRMRHCPTSESAELQLEALIAGGFGQWEYPSPDLVGGRPTRVFQVFQLHRCCDVTTPPTTAAPGGVLSQHNGDSQENQTPPPEPVAVDEVPLEVYDRLPEAQGDAVERAAIMAVEAE